MAPGAVDNLVFLLWKEMEFLLSSELLTGLLEFLWWRFLPIAGERAQKCPSENK